MSSRIGSGTLDEVGGTGVSDGPGHVGHAQAPVQQQLPRPVQAQLLEELVRRAPGDLAEQMREGGGAQVHLLGHIVDCDGLGEVLLDVGERRGDRIATRLLGSDVQHPRELLALEHPVHHLLNIERGEDPPIRPGAQALQEPDHDTHQLRVERRDHALLRYRRCPHGWEAGRGSTRDHVGRHLLDQPGVDLQYERQTRLAGTGLKDLGLEMKAAAQHQVVERVVDVGFAFGDHRFAALGHDADRQGLDLFPGRFGRLVEPVDRQPGPQAGVRPGLGSCRSEGHRSPPVVLEIPGRHLHPPDGWRRPRSRAEPVYVSPVMCALLPSSCGRSQREVGPRGTEWTGIRRCLDSPRRGRSS